MPMVAAGLVDEVRGLLAAGFRDGVTAPQAIGYKEIVEALDGNITLEEAVPGHQDGHAPLRQAPTYVVPPR